MTKLLTACALCSACLILALAYGLSQHKSGYDWQGWS
jgi:hypothetical protein